MNEYLKTNVSTATYNTHLRNLKELDGLICLPMPNLILQLTNLYETKSIFQLGKTILKVIKYKITQETMTETDYNLFSEFFKKIKIEMEEHHKIRTRQIKQNLIEGKLKTKKQLFEALDTYYETDDYKRYIFNYLLMHYHVRNLDLDVIISHDEVTTTQNHLQLKDGKLLYIRNNYKTYKLYGEKIYEITDKRFIYAVGQLPIGRLLNTKNIAQELHKYITDGMTEAMVNKITIETMTMNELLHASEARGTSLDVLIRYYNINI